MLSGAKIREDAFVVVSPLGNLNARIKSGRYSKFKRIGGLPTSSYDITCRNPSFPIHEAISNSSFGSFIYSMRDGCGYTILRASRGFWTAA